MSPFRYSKVSSESSQDSSLENQRIPPRRNRCCSIFEKLEFLRWPVTFFLLFTILLCELSMLQNRPKAVLVGTDFNSIVPVCKLAIQPPVQSPLMHLQFRPRRRSFAATRDSDPTTRQWNLSTKQKKNGPISSPVSNYPFSHGNNPPF